MGESISRPGRAEDIEARKRKQKAAELENESRRLDIEYLMKTPQFRRYIRRVLASGGMMQSVMTGNSQTFYKSGRQDFTREIWAELAIHDRDGALDLMVPQKNEDDGQ